jgi:ATP/maltotriose-dependent transcriptional regulator MalT
MLAATMAIVGREPELQAIDDALDRLELAAPGVIEFAGEPGIGKTRLMTELTTRARARGYQAFAASASQLEEELPFGLFVDALDAHVDAPLDDLDADARAELAHVFPTLRGTRSELTDAPQERYRTHRAIRQLLEVLSRPAPLVLALDDLHWADSGSIELLGSLLRRPPAAPVLVAIALRPRQAPDRVAAALARARRSGELLRLDLATLSEPESRALLGDRVSASVGAALHEESGGNPFYLEQLARSLERRLAELPTAEVLTGLDVPRMVAATLADELALLRPGTRRLLEGAAVAGDPFELDLAAAAADQREAEAMDALDELLAGDVVRSTEVPRRFRFRHPLVRQAVYEAAPGGWRLGAHERCAEALAARGAPAASRAHHVEQVGRHGDESAIAVLQGAGEAAAQRTPAGAARWFNAALRLLGPAAAPERRIELLTGLARALAATGQFEQARQTLEEELRLLAPDAVAQRVALVSAVAAVEQLLGRHEEARARLETVLAGLADQDSREAAGLRLDLAMADFYRLEFAGANAHGARALEIAEALADRPLKAGALGVLALVGAFTATRDQADARCDAAAALIDVMSDDEIALRLDGLSHLASGESYAERFDASARHAERGFAVARATGQGELLPLLVPALATVFLALGRVADGIELTDGAIESARLTGNTQSLVLALYNRAMMGLLAGDLDGAQATAEEAVELVAALDVNVISAWAGAMLAFAQLERGEHAAGVETMVRLCGGPDLPLIGGSWRALPLERLALGQLALGRRADAERTVRLAQEIAEATGQRHPEALAKRAAAALALDAGEHARAAELALRSAVVAESIGARLEAARARTLAGRALAAAGETDRAVAELERAASELDACGAHRYRDHAEQELGRLGRRRHRRTRPGSTDGTGVETLTERELQVARLIVARRTNAQIAAELFLSRKTVEAHVRNLFV